MWLRLALNTALVLLFSACSPSDKAAVDKLNSISYAYHYRDIDSTACYAQQVLAHPDANDDQRAEALNHLAFCSMVRMNYAEADSLLKAATTLTDNQIELLVSYVQQMRLCQRRSHNREFYEYRVKAVNALNRINEERQQLDDHQRRRLCYAESEMAIVTSTYYYYVGLERQSIAAMEKLNLDEARHDTAQYLNYLYNVGAGGFIMEGSAEEIIDEEMDYLERCLSIADRYGYVYFQAQAKEGLADHTGDLLLAEEALDLFRTYGDVYQIAGAYRTLASCYHAMGDDYHALQQLDMALADTLINQAPDLVASIREQLSVAYSAINDKPNSDYNRNIYIDLQEQTRQDRELEARAGVLDHAVSQLNWMMLAVIIAILLILLLLWLFNHQHHQNKGNHALDEQLEQMNESVAMARQRVETNERRHLEQRAKVSLAVSILPLIDRILYTVQHAPIDEEYVRELTDNINDQNEQLTQWIQLRQGELNMHIESFPLQELFDIVSRSQRSFAMKGVQLDVQPTDAVVKADRVLTLFMLNTLADNARKFTPPSGQVNVAAQVAPDYVEISVSDTGCGMSSDQLAHVFDHKVVDNGQQSHGFGLMNCKGIIEKYRKMSQLFSVCQLQASSEEGKGSRFTFRLPKGLMRLFLLLLSLVPSTLFAYDNLSQAHIFADSAYFSNVNGTYSRTLQFADSCRQYLNAHYRQQHPHSRLLMRAIDDSSALPAEIQWLHDSLNTNYQIILDIRNESAVAALALHEWQLYQYNNKVYTQLFKELSADNTLAAYCRTMQQSQVNKRIGVILLLVLLVTILPAYYMLYYRHRLHERFRKENQQQTDIEMAADELKRAELENAKLHVANAVLDNCLSTLKHETMYYPSRIRQLVDNGDTSSLAEVTAYYRDLYSILIRQATGQVEAIHLHVHPVELYGSQVLGDANLLRYLFELLKGEVTTTAQDDRYVTYELNHVPPVSVITQLLCRQILRDHGEATNRRGCGITMGGSQVTIILPRYNGKI